MGHIIFFVFTLMAVSSIHASKDVCGLNECSNICGHLCEPTCENPKPNPLTCPKIKCTDELTRACRCNEGYYRDKTTGRCVCLADCPVPTTTTTTATTTTAATTKTTTVPPPVCCKNEQLGNCGRLCEKTCSKRDLSQCAATSCSGLGCQCKSGYYRNEETDLCVQADQCPQKCCQGEIRAACGKKCEGTCDSPVVPEICKRIKCATQGCRCDFSAGFVRNNATGKCVKISKCPPKKPICPPNSAPKLCGKFGEPTCRDPVERLYKVDPSKCTVDCRCMKGYVRNEQTKKCVKPEYCCYK